MGEYDYDNDPVLQRYKFPSQQQSVSDVKRLAALQAKLDQEKASQQLIKSALSGQVLNKKIVFSNPSAKKPSPRREEEPKQKFIAPSLKNKQLFEDDEDDEKGPFGLDISSKRMHSSKESKIVELQSRFAHDPRFRIDDKFIDDEDETNFDAGKTNESKTETEKELDILEDVLGKPLRRKFKHSTDKPSTNSLIIPRYDPTKPESQKFKIRKVEKLEPYQLPKDEEKEEFAEKSEISKERFYEISETFTKDFADTQTDGQSFSLSAMFGRSLAEIPETSVEIGAVKTKKSKSHDAGKEAAKKIKKNLDAMKEGKSQQDSEMESEDEVDENDDDEDESSEDETSARKRKRTLKEPEPKAKKLFQRLNKDDTSDLKAQPKGKSKVSNPLLKYERFFFTANDERFANNTFYKVERIKGHIAAWKEKKIAMTTALTKKRRHFKHVSKLKSALESGETGDKDLKLKYRIYKETTKKH